MKGQQFHRRLGFALAGWVEGFRGENSFRTQVAAAALAVLATAALRPPLVWWALVVVSIALVLAAELFNTALERIIDGLHPDKAEFIRQAKDCAAGAVLVFSVASVVVFCLMLLAAWRA
ncbi:MAG: diacylglycerol kinase [Rhodocyclaceae bacterium]|nr:diacylglycerol kinase [Rhodocyclaceae bacterium]